MRRSLSPTHTVKHTPETKHKEKTEGTRRSAVLKFNPPWVHLMSTHTYAHIHTTHTKRKVCIRWGGGCVDVCCNFYLVKEEILRKVKDKQLVFIFILVQLVLMQQCKHRHFIKIT